MTALSLAGKSALVTGSTSGIGQAIASQLAKAGASVMLNGLGDADLIESDRIALADESDSSVFFHPADLRLPKEIDSLFERIQECMGGVDILVNNAGIQFVAPIEDFPVDKWDDIIAVNLSAAFHCTRRSVAHMKENGWGRIINLASAHALVASPFKSAYVAAKHGIAGLTKTVALEVAEHGVTCNAICPGYVWTPLVKNQIADTARARGISEAEVVNDVMLSAQPTKSFVTVEQLAEMVLFLCSPAAASITGSLLPVDGGWTSR